MTDIINAEKDFEIKMLKDALEKSYNEVTKLKILLQEAGVETDAINISSEEIICVKQIERLKEISEERLLSHDETKQMDLVVKNLKLIRGENTRVGRKSKVDGMSKQDLLKKLKEADNGDK